MRPDDIEPLLTRAIAGDREALALLIARADVELRVLVADHAVSSAMVDEVLTAVWEEAFPRLVSAARGAAFAPWLWDIARDLLARALHERDRVATERKDPIAHALTRAAIDGLDRGYADEVAGLAAFKGAVERLEPAAQTLLRRRYGEGVRAESLAQTFGQPINAVSAALFRARAAARGQLEAAEALLGADPLFAGLVEDFLADAIIPDARTLLADSVTKDLQYHAAFEVQARADLLLTAMHAAPSLEAARALARAVVPEVRTSQRLRAVRPSDRQNRISDGRRRAISSGNLPAASTSGSRPVSGRHHATGSHRRATAVEPTAPEGSGVPWTMVGVAAVVIAIVIGFAATRGGPPPRGARPTGATPASTIAAAPTPRPAPVVRDPDVAAVGGAPRPAPTPAMLADVPPPSAWAVPAAPPAAPVASAPLDIAPPAIRLAAPGALTAGVAAALTVEVVGGAPLRVEALVDGAVVGAATAAPFVIGWTPPRAGSVRIEARADDARGRVAQADAVLATVAPAAAPTIAVALTEPTAERTFNAPATIALAARVDGPAPDRVEFYQGEAKIAEADHAPFAAAWTRVPTGAYQVTARVRRGDRVFASPAVTVVVAPPAAQPPTVHIESPADFDSVAENAKIMLRARAGAKDAAIARVEFWADGKRIGEKTTSPYDLPWPKPTPGEHIVTAIAIDERGGRGESEPVLVLVGRRSLGGLVRAIAFGADPVEVDGWRFTPVAAATADGFSVGNGRIADAARPPAGELDGSTRALTAHVLTGDEEQVRCAQALPDGFYQVYAYVTDAGEGAGLVDLELEGAHTPSCRVAKAAWGRSGPFNVRVTDGALNIVATRHGGARLCGLAILGALRDAPPPSARGFVWERWDGVGNLADLRRNPRFPAAPNATGRGDALRMVGIPNNVGVRFSAWIVPPQTGNYRFWLASDDEGELWLGNDDTPAKMSRIAWSPSIMELDYLRRPEQQSGEILLVAGHRYPLQALVWGGPGPNGLTVRWRLPDGTMQDPLPADALAVASGGGVAGLSRLAVASRARADDARVAPAPVAAAPSGPAIAATVLAANAPGAIRVEYWQDVPPKALADAWATVVAARPPDQTRYAASCSTEANRGDHYVARIRGSFKPPISGAYVFSLDCDDRGEVRLAPIDDPSASTVVVEAVCARARSAPIALDATRAYALEARMIEYDNGDWCRVGWTMPDGVDEFPIPAKRFTGTPMPTHGLKREVWRPVPGNIVDDLLNHPSYAAAPTRVEWLDRAIIGEDGPDYGARFTAWLTAPQTGVYRLRISASADARVFIGDADKAPSPGIVRPHTRSDGDGWLDAGAPKLEQGRRYWLEILHKRFQGGDHLAFGWVMPDGTAQEPIDPQYLTPAP